MKNQFSIRNKASLSLFSVILIMLVFMCPVTIMAESENEALKARIERLEKELGELKAILTEKATSAEKQTATAQEAPKASDGFSVKSYGYIKLDAAYNDSRVSNGNFATYVFGEGAVNNDDTVNFTARQSRLGLDITAPDYNGFKTKGKVEVDFYGDGSAAHENKAEPMLRQAYLETTRGGMSILAGQTSDVISPLNPSTLNYTVGWSAGNIGYRRAQLRLSYNKSFDESTGLLTQIALARTTGLTNEDFDANGVNDGDDSGFPSVQGRFAITTKGLAGKKNVIGISGHFGREEADWAGAETDLDSWSANIDFVIPLTERFTLSGEAFTGENLDDYFGGILQGVNTITRSEISSKGMWSQINFALNKKWQYNAGFGIDNPDTNDINIGSRDKNSYYFVNTMFKVLPMLTIGFEYSYWETEYKGAADGTANRFHTSAIFTW
ncbi:MAG: hypothetical protein GX654_03515 [Desulfatiglans sp.]|jgi:hypothetical protein|nr:hypothetical protein [Desulfatiglans sp.]